MLIKGVLTMTINRSTFRNKTLYHDIMPDCNKNPHRCRATLQQFANVITDQIVSASGNTITATPSLFPVTDNIFVLRFSIVMSDLAVTHSKVVSADICGFFAYLLDVDRTTMSFKHRVSKSYAT